MGVFEVHMCILTGGWAEEPEDADGVPRCGGVCGRASHLFNIICPRGQLYEEEGLNR